MATANNLTRKGSHESFMAKVRGRCSRKMDQSGFRQQREREKNKYHSTRRDYRGDEEGSRYRNTKREHARYSQQENRSRALGPQRGEDIRVDTSKETREEGEIRDVVKSHQLKENS
ncbi:hypothetical protein Bca52824_018523 [Brassica carinata]|uniref:Uncharacterized protein n=1 Tax=Brassica carinata TaxID=52824 RepID=A0A8X7VQ71_BRACI|nr:hypothetical protein Bca52824_018523 [Brassica carinata]